MIKSINLEKLFNEFDYKIDFENREGITIITGPNGSGKSTILKIIEAISEKDLSTVYNFPFRKVELELTDNSKIDIEKKQESLVINGINLNIPEPSNRLLYNYWNLDNVTRAKNLIKYYDNPDFLNLKDDDGYLDSLFNSADKGLVDDQVLLYNYHIAKKDRKQEIIKLSNQIKEFRDNIGKIKFIREQRLLKVAKKEKNVDAPKIIETIEELPNKIMDIIKNVVLNYSEISSQLDSSFPKRFIQTNKKENKISDNQLKKITYLQEKINAYSLIKKIQVLEGIEPSKMEEEKIDILILYLIDSLKKLQVFENLIQKLDAFVEMVNKKLSGKSISISSEYGIKVDKDNKDKIALKDLSSGEQEIIVILYELLFESDDKTVLLIDEPEISLHVAWQKEIVEDIKKCVKLSNNKIMAIICTHSPQVINNKWNSIVELSKND